jgi:K+-sensing histidine kinase KdpD
MIAPEIPKNENQRQLAVEKYQLLDTLSEESYDNITSLMSYICQTPISLITLLDNDRNFLKSHHGIPFNESPREISFCGHAINSEDSITIVEDSRKDERFFDNPLVTEHQAIFYAGVPLVDSDGYKLGTLCVYDVKPRILTVEQKNALTAMAKQVINLFEKQYQNLNLLKLSDKLKTRNDNLQKFANVVTHDLKSPLTKIVSLSELIALKNKDVLKNESLKLLNYLKSSSYSLRDYVDGILEYYQSDELLKNRQEEISVHELIEELKSIVDPEQEVSISLSGNIKKFTTNKSALMQVLINLTTNAIKYNSKSSRQVDIKIMENANFYEFSVKDNGDGIPQAYFNEIFDLFVVVGVKDREGKYGTGIGLAMVKKIITNLGGEISVSSKEGDGSTFIFNIAKVFLNK